MPGTSQLWRFPKIGTPQKMAELWNDCVCRRGPYFKKPMYSGVWRGEPGSPRITEKYFLKITIDISIDTNRKMVYVCVYMDVTSSYLDISLSWWTNIHASWTTRREITRDGAKGSMVCRFVQAYHMFKYMLCVNISAKSMQNASGMQPHARHQIIQDSNEPRFSWWDVWVPWHMWPRMVQQFPE